MKNLYHCSRFTDRGPSIAARVIRTVRNFSEQPVCEKGNANWISETSFVTKKYYITTHSSTEMTPIQSNRKISETEVFKVLHVKTQKQKTK